jgi:phospholipase C
MDSPPPRRIDHVVVLMLENRSFDNIFGYVEAPEGQTVENLPPTETTAADHN